MNIKSLLQIEKEAWRVRHTKTAQCAEWSEWTPNPGLHSPSSAWLGSHGVLLWQVPRLEPWAWVDATGQGSQLQLQATEVQKYQARQNSENTVQHELQGTTS